MCNPYSMGAIVSRGLPDHDNVRSGKTFLLRNDTATRSEGYLSRTGSRAPARSRVPFWWDVKREQTWVRVGGIVGHYGNLWILNDALKQEVSAIMVCYLPSTTEGHRFVKSYQNPLCLVRPLAINTWGYWEAKYLGLEAEEKLVSCKHAMSVCWFLRYLKTFTLFCSKFIPWTFSDSQFSVMVEKQLKDYQCLRTQTPQTPGGMRKGKIWKSQGESSEK